VHFAFDILFADGHDVRRCPLHERKALLQRMLDDAACERVVYVDHLVGRGAELLAAVREIGGEGIVSKRTASLYRGGESRDWMKTKCFEIRTFHITGFKKLGDGRLDELRVSEEQDGVMRSVGHVRFGFAGKGLWDVLDVRQAGPARKGVIPIKPLRAEVRFYGRHKGGAIRDGVFLSWIDEPAMPVRLARPVLAPTRTPQRRTR
jgi:bifunctional non-homologous end joining protein LigD